MAERRSGVTRRELLQSAGAATLALGTGTLGAAPGAAAPARPDGSDRGGSRGPYNVLFILTDQERHFRADEIPPGFSLPGREALRRRGVTFTNHQIASAVCSSSRAVIYTGQHIQRTKVFDNLNFPWSNDLDPAITPTLGHMLGQAGYYAAYKGKWHLTREMDTHDSLALPETRLTRLMRTYGFEDYVGIGDVIGLTHGGFLNDALIGAQARRWLRLHGRRLNEQGQPWLLAVNFVNPHDVMFFDTDAPGEAVQSVPAPLMRIAREPDTPMYQKRWALQLPRSRREPFDAPGRPAAHREFQRARSALVGTFPNEDARWRRLLDYYYNCLR
ncbi:MAG: sulfatase-like hydrolase/transferase, partial [Myxococcota bacterium]|nr:sulfatase-like hydrolase/transferase [Myxococcota bacterium]